MKLMSQSSMAARPGRGAIGRQLGTRTVGPEEPLRDLDRADAAAAQAEPAIDALLPPFLPEQPVRGHPALRVPGQPERRNVLQPVLSEHILDDVAQVVVVGLRHPAPHRFLRRRRGRGDDQPVLFLVVVRREVQVLPLPHRPAAMQAQDERQRLPLPEVVRFIKRELAAGQFIGDDGAGHR
jgi:hypothetical protein